MAHGSVRSDVLFQLSGTRIRINCRAYENCEVAESSLTHSAEIKCAAQSFRLDLPSAIPPLPNTLETLPSLVSLFTERGLADHGREENLGHLEEPHVPPTAYPEGEDRIPFNACPEWAGVDAILITSPDGLLGLPALIKQHKEKCAFIPPPKVGGRERGREMAEGLPFSRGLPSEFGDYATKSNSSRRSVRSP